MTENGKKYRYFSIDGNISTIWKEFLEYSVLWTFLINGIEWLSMPVGDIYFYNTYTAKEQQVDKKKIQNMQKSVRQFGVCLCIF